MTASSGLWSTAGGEQIGEPLSGLFDLLVAVGFAPGGEIWAAGSDYALPLVDPPVPLWDSVTGRPSDRGVVSYDTHTVDALAFSPDVRLLANAAGDTVQLWDLATRQLAGPPLTGHLDEVTAVAFSPDGRQLATGSRDTGVRLCQRSETSG